MTPSHKISLRVNGEEASVDVPARWSLAETLREELQLSGTKVGCEQGICGTCTVLLDGAPVRSCLVFAVQAEGRDVETIEGLLGDPLLVTLQDSFMAESAFQCGFCTSGFLVLAYAFARELEAAPTRERIREALSANICRCTGYQGLVDAVARATEPPV